MSKLFSLKFTSDEIIIYRIGHNIILFLNDNSSLFLNIVDSFGYEVGGFGQFFLAFC
jgi:hypothetical protein